MTGRSVSLTSGIALANLGADFGVVGNEAVRFDGVGRAYGMEFLAQRRLYKGVYGLLAYTYVRSEYEFNGEFTPSAWDSRHIVSLTGGAKLKRDWEIGVRWLYGRVCRSHPMTSTSRSTKPTGTRTTWPSSTTPSSTAAAMTPSANWTSASTRRFFETWSLDVFMDVQNLFGQVADSPDALDVVRGIRSTGALGRIR